MAKHTGYIIRVYRDKRWVNLDIAETTEEELRDYLVLRPRDKVEAWVVALVNWIKDFVDETSEEPDP